MHLIKPVFYLTLSLGFVTPAFSDTGSATDASNTESFVINSPIVPLGASELDASKNTDNPLGNMPSFATNPLYKDGVLTGNEQARALLAALNVPTDKPVIINLVRWADEKYTTITFEKWYLYNPQAPIGYARSQQKLIADANMPGVKDFYLVYVHFYWDVGATLYSPPKLNDAFSYKVVITKQKSQFVQDLSTLVQIVTGVAVPFTSPTSPGYYSSAEIHSKFDTSSIVITPTTTNKPPPAAAAPAAATPAASVLGGNTYTNQPLSHWGLSFAVPVTSYKDVTYQSSGSTVTPTTITQQSVYANLDFYYPAAEPGLMALRYIPHPFIGLPIKGKVFEHSMAGLAFGVPWCELYAGAVFDTQNESGKGSSSKLTIKGSFGIKVSVSAVAKALKIGS